MATRSNGRHDNDITTILLTPSKLNPTWTPQNNNTLVYVQFEVLTVVSSWIYCSVVRWKPTDVSVTSSSLFKSVKQETSLKQACCLFHHESDRDWTTFQQHEQGASHLCLSNPVFIRTPWSCCSFPSFPHFSLPSFIIYISTLFPYQKLLNQCYTFPLDCSEPCHNTLSPTLICQTTWYHIPEDHNLNSNGCENSGSIMLLYNTIKLISPNKL